MVFCVSTIHRIGHMIKRLQNYSQITVNNNSSKACEESMWGDKGAVNKRIPTSITDYNHWMVGVDISNQQISYYHSQFF